MTKFAALLTLALLPACAMTPKTPVEESYVRTSDGALLAFERFGRGEEVMIAPGLSYWGADARYLAKNRTVIFYDMRGRGKSSENYSRSLEEDVRDLEEVRKWFGLEKFTLIAPDYRGTVAASYAAFHPEYVEKLVLVSPIPISKEPYWDVYERMYNDKRNSESFRELNKQRRTGEMEKDPAAWNAAYTRALFEPMVKDAKALKRMQSRPFTPPNNDPEKGVVRYLALLRSFGEWNWVGAMRQVRCPTLIIRGQDDPVPTPAATQWRDTIPGAKLESIAGSGHLPWLERASALESAVDEFLK